jgi:hypothetical protein
LLIISIPLDFAWEMLQAPGFTGLPSDRLTATGVCAVAAVAGCRHCRRARDARAMAMSRR